MTFKVAIVGPESTGKSKLAHRLSFHYRVPLVLEYARQYLDMLDRSYEREDLVEIAKGQLERERRGLSDNPPMVIFDTNLLVIKVWSLYKYEVVDDFISNNYAKQRFDLQLLLKPDLPWEDDEQRENPHDRDHLFTMYHQELVSSGQPFVVIGGQGEERFQNAISQLREFGIA